MTLSFNKSLFSFLAITGLIISICCVVTFSNANLLHTNLFSLCITADLVFFIPFVYFLFIRNRSIPKITIIPIVILSFIIATLILPPSGRIYLDQAKMLLIPIELLGTGFIIYKVHQTAKEYTSLAGRSTDFLENLRYSLYKIIGKNRAADMMATEISVSYYGFFAWRKKRGFENGQAFTYHKNSGYGAIVGVFIFLILLESVWLHLALMRWSNIIAWTLTVLSIYTIIFLVADYNASLKRPIQVDDQHIIIRIGLRWTAIISISYIDKVYRKTNTMGQDINYCKMVLMGSENVILELNEPVRATGLYGMSKTFNQLGLSMDQPDIFVRLIEEKIKESSPGKLL